MQGRSRLVRAAIAAVAANERPCGGVPPCAGLLGTSIAGAITELCCSSHGSWCWGTASASSTSSPPPKGGGKSRTGAKTAASTHKLTQKERQQQQEYAPAQMPPPRRSSLANDLRRVLSPAQRELLAALLPSTSTTSTSGNDGSATAQQQQQQQRQQRPLQARDLSRIGWPLSEADVMKLLQQNLSDTPGQGVPVVPIFSDNALASAGAVAQDVAAALAEDTSWMRIVRRLEAKLRSKACQALVKGMKVQVKGRFGRRADMASKRIWMHGRCSTSAAGDPVDAAHSLAHTRMGSVGVKVWIVYNRSCIPGDRLREEWGVAGLGLRQLLARAPPRRQVHPPAAGGWGWWWDTPGPLQPAVNRAWECFAQHHPRPPADAPSRGRDTRTGTGGGATP